jgi:hypothetical protein
MPITSASISDGSRADVLAYIRAKKAELSSFRVIDVGGGVHSWCIDNIDALVDMNPSLDEGSIIQVFKGDINEKDVWCDISLYIENNGGVKFDFCVCTHTLEDIRNPLFVCQQMEHIAEAGYIAVPSKHVELSRFEFGPNCHRGYIHHRWIFDIRVESKTNENKATLVGYPKLTIVEHMAELDKVASRQQDVADLNLYWHHHIGLRLCNNDYMGPNAHAVVRYLYELAVNKFSSFSSR